MIGSLSNDKLQGQRVGVAQSNQLGVDRVDIGKPSDATVGRALLIVKKTIACGVIA